MSANNNAGSTNNKEAPARQRSFFYQDGKASVEHHLGILLEDLSKYGSQLNLTAAEDLMVGEAFSGLLYVLRMRVQGNLHHLDKDLCERLRQALVLFTCRTVTKGPKLLSRPVPSRHSVFALIVFCGLAREVEEFLEVVNHNMSVADIRRALDLRTWLTTNEIEEEEEEEHDPDGLSMMVWTTMKVNVEDVRKLAVATTLYLAQVLNAAKDWRDLVEPRAHSAFEKYMKENNVEAAIASGKALLAPKGQYWDTPVHKVLAMFRTTVEQGLTNQEVLVRREVYGDNKPPEVAKTSYLGILLRQLADLIVLILIAAAIVSIGLGDYDTAAVLGIVIFINTFIGFWQEVKAERAISALASLTVPQCTVVREGQQCQIDAGDLVPGDIVVLEEGSAVPADLRLVSVAQLAIIETLLTGESVPLDKSTDPVVGHKRVNIGDRVNTAFQSTTVTKGRGIGVVVNTGESTEIGRISAAIAGTHVGKTPLQKKLVKLGKVLVVFAIFACGLVIAAGLIWDPSDSEIIKVGVSLALSVIPEGLVAIVTLTMALGMTRMAKKDALVRQLPAVETLGSVTTICSDKTGTITEGVMKARLLWAPSDILCAPAPLPDTKSQGIVTFKPNTTAAQALQPKPDLPVATPENLSISTLWQLAVLSVCNNSTTKIGPDGNIIGLGDQTEVALKILAAEVHIPWLDSTLVRKHEIAFDSDRKRMSVIAEISENGPQNGNKFGAVGSKVVLSKGAPEFLFQFCTHFLSAEGKKEPLTVEKLSEIESWCDNFSEQGLRTLALAARWDDPALDALTEYDEETVEKDLCVIGLVALADPPRRGIEKSIQECHTAGIRVVMITGDHVRTAMSIARSIGILPPAGHDDRGLVMNGQALSSMTVEQISTLQPFPVVFSRVSPDNKLNIVKGLQLRGDIAAMTGDGVNDAPAIRQADVGIAMGKSGTDITRQAADIILANDNFCTIVSAVEEGRKIYDNIVKFIVYLLSCNLSEVVLMLVAVVVGKPAPLNALQILYANIVVDIPPSLALGAEGIEPDAMTRKPRDPRKSILGKRYTNVLIMQALSIGLLAFTAYILALEVFDESLEKAQSMCFAVLFITQTCHAFMCRSIRNSLATTGPKELFLGNMWLCAGCSFSVAAVVAGIYIPGFNGIFGLHSIDAYAWIMVVISIVVHLCVVEAGKFAIRHVKSDVGRVGGVGEAGVQALV